MLQRFIRNSKGQVAIFVALIFQVLFLFFAMIINVGLLVHHKINLQNSVDLAAYYGAMKQAEMMNAIGHTNYQIRQSWKLLSWRYRALGTAGDWGQHPYQKPLKTIPSGFNYEGVPTNLNTQAARDYFDAPAFCITYSPFHPMPGNETTCKQQSSLETVKLFRPPENVAPFYGINEQIKNSTQAALDSALARCRYVGQFNFVILARFLAAYNFDQGERRQLISYLSNGLSEKPDDFREIDGTFVSQGIQKTLENNLTSPNREALKDSKRGSFKIYNSLGQDACGRNLGTSLPAKWLSEIKIAPAFAYMDYICRDRGDPFIAPEAKELSRRNLPNNPGELINEIEYLKNYVDPVAPPYNASVGVEKNPWCMAYVGVSAEVIPEIPFAPLGGVKLKARAYAKPFGAKIGPWFYESWPQSAEESTGEQIDRLLPKRVKDPTQIGEPRDPTRAPNYSRFVGDQFGLKSMAVLGQWGRAIHNLDPNWTGYHLNNAMNGSSPPPGWIPDAEPSFWSWNHLALPFLQEKTGDMLAWNSQRNAPMRIRDLETAAILPDQFDLTYYNIEPDFYHNYYLKLLEYQKKVPGFSYMIRPDLGVRLGNKDYQEFGIRDQYKVLARVQTPDFNAVAPQVDMNNTLKYTSLDVNNVLTSWVPKDLSDYSLDESRFGRCPPEGKPSPDVPTPGDCVGGGRAGYSVKLISSDYLNSNEHALGGKGGGSGPIKNPPPADF